MRPPFTETHVHFHDLLEPTLRYDWLAPDPDEPDLGVLRVERYRAEDFLTETRFQNVTRVIHMEATDGPDRVAETRWLQAVNERLGIPHGAIAGASLTAPDLDAVLAAQMAFPIVRGIRDLRYDDHLVEERWQAGFARLGEHDLICCLAPPIERYATAAAMAARTPQTTLCIDHTGLPPRHDDATFALWREELAKLAAVPSVVLKISGLAMGDRAWTPASLRRWVLTGIELFGVERCCFGTNWPVDRLGSSYGDVLDAYDEITADFTEEERLALFSGNANRIFRV